MRQTVAKLARLSAIYAVGDILTRGAGFLLLPLYTHYLPPVEYGVIAISEMIRQVLMMLLGFGTMSAVLRFYYQIESEDERRRFYGSMWAFLVIVPALIVFALDRWSAPLFGALFQQVDFERYIRPVLWSAYVNVAFTVLPPTLFRARERAASYVGFNVLSFAVTTSFVIWQIVGFQAGAAGYVRAQVLAALVLAVVGALVMLRQVSLSFDWALLRPMLYYSIPLIPHFVAHWVLNLSDRAILERYVSLDDLGVYALGYQIGLAYQLLAIAMVNALTPTFSRAAQSEVDRQMLPTLSTYYILGITVLALAVCLTAGDILALFTPEVYHGAAAIVPWVVMGSLALSAYYIPMNAISMVVGKTGQIPLITMTAAAVNIGLNLLFIPRFGMIAAAVNTLIGYAVLFGMTLWLARRTGLVIFEYVRVAKIALAVVLVALAASALPALDPFNHLVLSLVVLLIFPLALLLVNFWTPEERVALLRRSPWAALRSHK